MSDSESPAKTPEDGPSGHGACVVRASASTGWCELLAGTAGASGAQLIAVTAPSSPPPVSPSDGEHVLQGARRCGRRFMRVFSDNLHNCYVDLLDSKHMMEFRARALKRRLCRGSKKEGDNELYRSNSFKFERFERKDDPNDKQVQ